MTFPERVRLVEVGPRDGLQGEAVATSPATRVEFIELLLNSGLKCVEVGSFVSEKAVPQMSGTGMVLASLGQRPDARFSVLVPNVRGFRDAMDAGAQEVAIITAASETFCLRNMNCTIAESLVRAAEIAALARTRHIRLRAYISCALGCPFEGSVDAGFVADIARELLKSGCEEISLGDTIGTGTPLAARRLIECVARDVPLRQLAGHFHDTYGQAIANIFACLEIGIEIFDTSVSGLGGCPFAPGATGNVATEDVVYMLNGCGIEMGIDLDDLLRAGRFICAVLGHPPRSRVGLARPGTWVGAASEKGRRS